MTDPILPAILSKNNKFHWDLDSVKIESEGPSSIASVQVTWKDQSYTISVRKDGKFQDLPEAQEALKAQIDTAILLMARYASQDINQLSYENQELVKSYKTEHKPVKRHVDTEYEKQKQTTLEKLNSLNPLSTEHKKTEDRLHRIEEAAELQKYFGTHALSSAPIVVQAELDAKDQEIAVLREEIEALKSEPKRANDLLLDELDTLKRHQAQLEQQLHQQQHISEEKDAALAQLKELPEKIKEIGRLKDHLQKMRREKDQLVEQLQSQRALLQENGQLQNVRDELQYAKAKLTQLKELEKTVEQQHQQVIALTEETTSKQAKIANLESQLKLLRSQVTNDAQEITAVKDSAEDAEQISRAHIRRLEQQQRVLEQERRKASEEAEKVLTDVQKEQRYIQDIVKHMQDIHEYFQTNESAKEQFVDWLERHKRDIS